MSDTKVKHSSFLVFGDDSFRLQRRLKGLKKELSTAQPGITFVEAHPKDDLQSLIFGVSLFAEQKAILINLDSISIEDILPHLNDELPDSVKLILYKDGKLDKRLKSFKSLEKAVSLTLEVEQFSPWKTADILNWAKDQASELEVKIEGLALQKLVEYFSNNTALISSELARLSCFSGGETIKKEHVEALCQSSDDLFDLADLLLYKEFMSFASKLKKICNFQNSLGLIAGLQTIFRGYLSLKSLQNENLPPAEIARLTAKNPWKVSQDLQKLKNISFEYLLTVFQMLGKTEEDLKTGQSFDPDLYFRFKVLSLSAN